MCQLGSTLLHTRTHARTHPATHTHTQNNTPTGYEHDSGSHLGVSFLSISSRTRLRWSLSNYSGTTDRPVISVLLYARTLKQDQMQPMPYICTPTYSRIPWTKEYLSVTFLQYPTYTLFGLNLAHSVMFIVPHPPKYCHFLLSKPTHPM